MISIIVPVYNSQYYLARCIESIIYQEFSDFELILIDDGSQDESLKLCNRYAALDSRIIVKHKINEGVSLARNFGISLAHGEYIGFIDADDCINPKMYSIMYSTAKKYKSDLVFCDYLVFDIEDKIPTVDANYYCDEHYNKEKIFEGLYGAYDVKYVSCCTKLVKKELLDNVAFESNLRLGEDNLVAIQMYYNANNIYYIDKKLYYYFKNQFSVTRGGWSLKQLDGVKAYFLANEYWKKKNESYFSSLCLFKGYKLLLSTKYIVKKSKYKKEAYKILNSMFDNNFKELKSNIYIGNLKKFYLYIFRKIPIAFNLVFNVKNIFRN